MQFHFHLFFPLLSAACQMVVTDLTEPEKRADALSKLGLCFGIGMIAGSTLGGHLNTRYGWVSLCACVLCESRRSDVVTSGGSIDVVGWLLKHIRLLDTCKHMNVSVSEHFDMPLQSRGHLFVPEISIAKHLFAKFEGSLTQVNIIIIRTFSLNYFRCFFLLNFWRRLS